MSYYLVRVDDPIDYENEAFEGYEVRKTSDNSLVVALLMSSYAYCCEAWDVSVKNPKCLERGSIDRVRLRPELSGDNTIAVVIYMSHGGQVILTAKNETSGPYLHTVKMFLNGQWRNEEL